MNGADTLPNVVPHRKHVDLYISNFRYDDLYIIRSGDAETGNHVKEGRMILKASTDTEPPTR